MNDDIKQEAEEIQRQYDLLPKFKPFGDKASIKCHRHCLRTKTWYDPFPPKSTYVWRKRI